MDKTRTASFVRRWIPLAIVLLAFAFLGGGAGATAQTGPSISQVVVLGDSFSDNGNLFSRTGGPPPPYWQGRISNGPVGVEYLAQKLGVPLNDRAWAGATTGVGNAVDGGTVDSLGAWGLPGMTTAFQGLVADPVDPNALYILWGGGIDLTAAFAAPAEASVIIGKAVANLVTMAVTLQSLGATRVLVLNLQDFAKVPGFLQADPQIRAFITQGCLALNQALKINLPLGAHYFDTFSLFTGIIADPGEYGLSNVTDQLIAAPGADPNGYFFWDGNHFSTAGHAIMAKALFRSVAPTVIVGESDSGVPNTLLSSGSTISDLIMQAAFQAKNHGEFVSAVASITNGLVRDRVITGNQKGVLESLAARQ
ncbi:MAG TPA: SGNH/GDSL hydrolase family protein [Acidobacteriota bacterium]|nr:SGNH/GDSL hydrolase family protein [Acidobacteriota bacterium]